jgi:hypothetical protein
VLVVDQQQSFEVDFSDGPVEALGVFGDAVQAPECEVEELRLGFDAGSEEVEVRVWRVYVEPESVGSRVEGADVEEVVGVGAAGAFG